ncbi:MAG: hypothetical protein MMC23_005694 [Stictis urceolatum]|nr:hypothetical protein [Stictis urceolata]
MMLGEESSSAEYWKKCGDEALAHGMKGVVMMGAHWDAPGDTVEVSANPKSQNSPVAYVHPSKYAKYESNQDRQLSGRCLEMLKTAIFNARLNEKFDWIHDTYLILIRMFPDKCPPTTIISMNANYDPHFHMRIGSVLHSLRKEGYLIIGTGGAVHNLYRNVWGPMVSYRDNFAQLVLPEKQLLKFRQSIEDCFAHNRGPSLRRAITRLMKHPNYRDSHGTDDHFMALVTSMQALVMANNFSRACFVAGAAGDWEDKDFPGGRVGAETWELSQMCNSQFTIGSWEASKHSKPIPLQA